MRILRLISILAKAWSLGAAALLASGSGLNAAQDGPAGRVIDREGVGMRKGVQEEIWQVIEAGSPLQAGDWLRTSARGANAVQGRLAGGGVFVLGPGGLVEIGGGGRMRLLSGDLEVVPPEAGELLVHAGDAAPLPCAERRVLRCDGGELIVLAQDPPWLAGYRRDQGGQALGSLLASIDGRNVPLTLGYHKVAVDIRDQIARTVVEESFLNHTAQVLEGVFYFPLPADASISSFGVWVDDVYVEGELVEKQRARRIYETLLREQRDPALLEWSGGNVFQARVYPIAGAKRVRLSYTQVLPRQDGAYLYRYALAGELLRKHPLQELQIAVNVYDGAGLKKVESRSHDCRVRLAEHAASAEFSALDYLPDRDFELRVENAGGGPPLRFIPHRRGAGGYFMVLCDLPRPEAEAAAGPRPPLELLILADTSGSMHGEPRARQLAFLEALLASLSPADRFNLMSCDLEARWAFEQPQAAGDDSRERALSFLEQREPLGWSNLDQALAAAAARTGAQTQVIYLGDGVSTSREADPTAFARRVRGYYRGQGRFHAVIPSGSYDAAATQALARLGAGSWRTIDGEVDPARAAAELLAEIADPGFSELRLSGDGLASSAVHLATPPSLPPGHQHLLVGRFDPEASQAQGTLSLRASWRGRTLEYQAPFRLEEAEPPNSFIPRLWARRQLDALLAQGGAAETRDQVVALSVDYQIVTPHTSFLVLESAEDRERFAVEQRFRRRDAEQFFAQGQERARAELLRQQMQAAQGWRQNLRGQALRALSEMNRELMEQLAPARASWSYGWRGVLALGETAARYDDGPRAMASRPSPPAAEADPFGRELSELGYVQADGGEAGADEATPDGGFVAGDDDLEEAGEVLIGRKLQTVGAPVPSREEDWSCLPPEEDPYADPFSVLVPAVPPPRESAAPTWPWDEEISRLIGSLDRRAVVESLQGALRIAAADSYRDARGDPTDGPRHLLLIESRESWLEIRARVAGAGWTLGWLHGGERGLLDAAWQLGRARPARDGDRRAWSAPCPWYFGDETPALRDHEAELEKAEDGTAWLRLRHPRDPWRVIELQLHPERALLLQAVTRERGRVRERIQFADFVQLGGAWWPQFVHRELEGGGEWNTALRISTAPSYSQEFFHELARRDRVVLLRDEPHDAAQALQSVAAGTARLEDHWRLLRHYASRQLWQPAEAHFQEVFQRAAHAEGVFLITFTWFAHSRRHQELHQLLQRYAELLARGAPPKEGECSLAQRALSFADSSLSGAEKLELLRTLEPLFRRQEEQFLHAGWWWDEQWARTLESSGKTAAAAQKHRDNAADHPREVAAQLAYAQSLEQSKDAPAAAGHLLRASAEPDLWHPADLAQLRDEAVRLLWESERLAELAATVEEWRKADKPEVSVAVYDVYLAALYHLDRAAAAEQQIEQWLWPELEGATEDVERRLAAALRHAGGGGHELQSRRFPPAQRQRLVKLIRAYGESGRPWLLEPLSWYAYRLEECREALREWILRLRDEAQTLPIERIHDWTWLVDRFGSPSSERIWEEVAARLAERWRSSASPWEQAVLAEVILEHAAGPGRAAFLRERAARSTTPGRRAGALRELYEEWIGGPWTEAVEAELLALIPELSAPAWAALPGTRSAAQEDLQARLYALYQTADWLVNGRVETAMKSRPDFHLLSRRALKKEQEEARHRARKEAAERLAAGAAAADPALAPWALLESRTLLVQCREAYEDAFDAELAALQEQLGQEAASPPLHQKILAARRAALLSWTLYRMKPEQRVEREGAWTALLEDAARRAPELLDWRRAHYALLLALDRHEEAERRLREWYGDGQQPVQARWGVALAYARAEAGELAEATALLAAVEPVLPLEHQEWLSLAAWQTALGETEAAAAARRRSWEVLGRHTLRRMLEADLDRLTGGGDSIPTSVSAETIERLRAYLGKTELSGHSGALLLRLYQATRDFRLLESLPEAVLGRSSGAILEQLAEIDEELLQELRDEAAVDRILHYTGELLPQAAPADRRALMLLRFAVARRAAAQSQGAERHAAIALEALRESSPSSWNEAGALELARFHARNAVRIPEELGAEQRRQLEELHLRALSSGENFLDIGQAYAAVLWQTGFQEEADRVLEQALAADREANGGLLSAEGSEILELRAGYLQERGAYGAAEAVLRAEESRGYPDRVALALRLQLLRSYGAAYQGNGAVSLGAGADLYRGLRERLFAELRTSPASAHSAALLEILRPACRAAATRGLHEEAGRDLHLLAFEEFPGLVARHHYRGCNELTDLVQETLAESVAPRAALEFLVARGEAEPVWLAQSWRGCWRRNGMTLGLYRERCVPLDSSLEQRLYALTLGELKADLRGRASDRTPLCHQKGDHFWHDKRHGFRQAALDVLEESGASGATVLDVAAYLHDGLGFSPDAIAALQAAARRGVLAEDGRAALVDYLQEALRWEESLPLAEESVRAAPQEVAHRVRLVKAQAGAGRAAAARASLADAESWFRQHDQGWEAVLAELGRACGQAGLSAECIRYLTEAVNLRLREAPARSASSDWVLSGYYQELAKAYGALGQTREAVNAAAGAVLAWGSRQEQRQDALAALDRALSAAPDLDGYAQGLEAEIAASGLENPLLRKALARAYAGRQRWEQAIHHAAAAVQSFPEDLDGQHALAEIYRRSGQAPLAVRQLLEIARCSGHEIEPWLAYARAAQEGGEPAAAERAWTQVVEALPFDAESHRALAEARLEQGRPADAVHHWRQVTRLREHDPAGYLGLARALVAMNHVEEAASVLATLVERDATFQQRADELLKLLPQHDD